MTLRLDRRQVLAAGFSLGTALCVAGCGSVKPLNDTIRKDQARNSPPPDAASLVAYLNDNARRVKAIECEKVSIDCKQGNQSVGLEGLLACEKPRNFRLKAKILSREGADIGSNGQEFWFWISKTEPVPYVFHCSYADLARGNVEMPFPFQPEMIMSALGIAEYDPAGKYEVRPNGNTLELIEQAKSPSGEAITRITVFNRQPVPIGKQPQVIAHVIKDSRGQDLCVATVLEVAVDKTTNAVLPSQVKIVWPGKTQAERAEMKLRFYDMHTTRFEPQRAAALFSRQSLSGQPSFDLARRVPDSPGGITRTGGGAEIGRPQP